MNKNKYLYFDTNGLQGLSNFLLQLEVSLTISRITKRKLILLDKYEFGHNLGLVDISKYLSFETIKKTFECASSEEIGEMKIDSSMDLHTVCKSQSDIVVVISDNIWNKPNEVVTCGQSNSSDFLEFLSDRVPFNIDFPNKFLALHQCTTGNFWYSIYFEGKENRNQLKKDINNCLKYKKTYYNKSDIVHDFIGIYNSIHVRRGDFLNHHDNTILDPTNLLHRLQECFPTNIPIYISTDEKDLSFFDPLREKYQIYFLKDFDFGNLDKVEKMIIDQLVCSKSNLFGGDWYSTFTKRINVLRALQNLSTSDMVLNIPINFIGDYQNINFDDPMPWKKYGRLPWYWPSNAQWTYEQV